MRTLICAAMAASLALGVHHRKDRKHAEACPFVGVADIDNTGAVENMVGSGAPRAGSQVEAFDVDGAAGRLRVNHSGELHYASSPPPSIKNATFTHVLLVQSTVGRVHVADPGKDLPQGIFPDAVTIYLANAKGGKVALVAIPGQTPAQACSEIDCKIRGAWKRCWTDCQ